MKSNQKSLRDTRQRNAIRNAIERAGRPLGPKEILKLAGDEVPNLGIATVYRNIKTMVEQGELEVIDLPGQAPRYRQPSTQPHHLFIDKDTDAVYTVSPELEGFLPNLPDKYDVDDYQVIFHGKVRKKEDAPHPYMGRPAESNPSQVGNGRNGNGRNGNGRNGNGHNGDSINQPSGHQANS